MFPYCNNNKERNSLNLKIKWLKARLGFSHVFPSGDFGMGSSLAMWFVYCLIIGIFAAYISGHALPPSSNYLSVFRFIGAVAFTGYSLAFMQNSIWYKRNWGTTIKIYV